MGRRGLRWLALLLGALAVTALLGACGSDGDDEAATTTTAAPADEGEDEPADEPADEEDSGGSGASGEVPTADIGDCITDSVSGQSISSFEVVDCDEPHTAELIHKFDLPDGEFPDQAEAEAAVEEECLGDVFEDYVGTPYEESEIFLFPVTPTQETWEQADDREVLCFAGLAGGAELSESIEGSGR